MSVIDDFLADYSGPHRELMDEIRALVAALVPDAEEAISYGMPTFRLNGNLVHFAPGKNHVGLYPAPDGVSHVAAELDERGLRHSKGAIQFPIDQPLPRDLVERIVVFRADQQRAMKPARRRP